MSKNKISVVIRTKNEERWIGHCIQSLLDLLDFPEIVIVDNYSTDKTLEIVRNFAHDPYLKKNKNKNYTKIKLLNINNYTPGKSINFGVKASSGQYILIISAHCVLKKINFLQHIKDLKKNICIFGKQDPIYQGKKITKRYIWSHFINQSKINMYSEYENRYFMHNALSFFEKKTLTRNPFNENLQGKEDRYWINDMIKKNKNFLYDPSLSADHHYTEHGNTWKGVG